MAKFELELPTEVLRDFEKIHGNTKRIFGGMTKAGAEVVMNKVKATVPLSKMASHVKLTRTYKTPSDGGINTKVIINGYLPFSTPGRKTFSRRGGNGSMYHTSKGVPADFLAILYEYGRSNRPFPKKPFLRKAFSKGPIETAMYKAQKELSGGLLDE